MVGGRPLRPPTIFTRRTLVVISAPIFNSLKRMVRRSHATVPTAQLPAGHPCHAQWGVILKQMLNQSAALDRMFRALADPTRRVMVERLSRGPTSVSELAQPFAMSMSAVVQHLEVLEQSGLIQSKKVGRVRTCRIEPKALRTAEEWISRRRADLTRRLDRLGDYLAKQEEPQ
jgi:DNA-binding transcriptional ArsR family regulator